MELRRQQALELPTAARRVVASLVGALALAGPAHAAVATSPVYDSQGNLIGTPFVPPPAEPVLTEEEAVGRALAVGKVADWLDRYPEKSLTKEGTFDEDTNAWTVKVWSDLPDAGQIVLAKVDDTSGAVTEAWTGPQVAWKMARGYDGAFGRKINNPWIWGSLCVAFFFGLANLRRPLSIRNLDLLVLLSFGVSLYFFNKGEVFTAMPLAYPPLLYLLGRMAWIGWKGRGSSGQPVWPVWVLVAATVFLAGFRFGMNVGASNVIDVGLAGVIGAQRIVEDGEAPYGNMPDDEGEECGEPDADGYVRERIQTNGRCEVANGRGDTYGPISYLAYVPGFVAMGYDFEWDSLPAAHFTSLLWDALALIGLGVVGLRFGGARLGAMLAFAWAAYPFTQYVSNSNSNDSIMPALLIWGLVFVTVPWARGLFVGLAAWTKFAAFLLFPLWASYPKAWKWPRQQLLFLAGILLATALGFWAAPAGARPAPRRPRLLGPDVRMAALTPVAVLDLGLAGVPRLPGPARRADDSQRSARGFGVRPGVRAAHAEHRPAVRSHGRAAYRLRARVDSLVLPLHPLVLPLRRVRAARARCRSGGRAGAVAGGCGR